MASNLPRNKIEAAKVKSAALPTSKVLSSRGDDLAKKSKKALQRAIKREIFFENDTSREAKRARRLNKHKFGKLGAASAVRRVLVKGAQ